VARGLRGAFLSAIDFLGDCPIGMPTRGRVERLSARVIAVGSASTRDAQMAASPRPNILVSSF
jgi:hypothetical protein